MFGISLSIQRGGGFHPVEVGLGKANMLSQRSPGGMSVELLGKAMDEKRSGAEE